MWLGSTLMMGSHSPARAIASGEAVSLQTTFAEDFVGDKCPLSSGKSLGDHLLSLSLDMNRSIAQAVVGSQNKTLAGREATLPRADRYRSKPGPG